MYRTHPIVSRFFLPAGAQLDQVDINARSKQFMNELEMELPSITKLIVSEIVVSFVSSSSGLSWVATLRESNQIALKKFTSSIMGDLFAEEIDAIETDKKIIKSRVFVAGSAATHPAIDKKSGDLRKAAKSARTRRIRSEIHRDSICMPIFEGMSCRNTLPTGEIVFARFIVEQLTRTDATVRIVQISTPHLFSAVSNKKNTWVLVRSDQLRTVEMGQKLATAMDKKITLSGKLAAVLDWKDGLPAKLEPLEIYFPLE